MFAHATEITINILAAWTAGGLIGIERSYNGRAAGFRTHALVGLAAAVAMTMTFEPLILPGALPGITGRLDPTRLGQGVMAGVGFIGAGVIFKEGVSVQGLTSAACIWITSAIGMLFGLGLHFGGLLATAATLTTLILFRRVEGFMTQHVYAVAVFRFRADQVPAEQVLHDLLGQHDVELNDTSYKLCDSGAVFEYHGAVRTRRTGGLRTLAARLRQLPGLMEYELDRVSK
jgi:putative Mg2+ transporter-C (MgtC) family protein